MVAYSTIKTYTYIKQGNDGGHYGKRIKIADQYFHPVSQYAEVL